MELQGAEAARLHDRLDVAGRMVPEDADGGHEWRQRAYDRSNLDRRHEARRVLDEDEAECVGARLDRRHRVFEIGDTADFHTGHGRSVSSLIFAGTSPARTRPSPTRTAWAPAATT